MANAIGQISPNKGNIMIGKGFMLFRPEDETLFYHLGNCPTIEVTPKVTSLEHFDAMQGTKEKDLDIVTERAMDVKINMEEFTKRNLAMLLMGTIDDTDPDKPKVNIFARDSLTGELRYYAANDKGPRWYMTLLSVTFKPSGSFSPISEGFASMEVTGSANALDGEWGDMELQPAARSIAPENIFEPFISGEPNVGSVLTAMIGAWIGVDSFEYLWKADGTTPGATATSKTYVPVSGDAGKAMTVSVSGTNTIGTTGPVESEEVGPVVEY